MYYRKKYSGTIANFTDKRTITALNGTTTLSIFKNQTDIVAAAIVDILHDVGYPDARYDESSATLFLEEDDLNGIFFAYIANMQMGWRLRNGTSWTALTNTAGAGYQPFNTSYTTYSFYITIIGEPKAYFAMCFGTYSSPTSATASMIHIAFGKNVITGDDMFGIYASTGWTTVSSFYMTQRKVFIATATSHGFGIAMTGLAGNIVLVRRFSTLGYVFLNNVFFANTAAHSYGQLIFMQCNGDTYWCANSYLLVKCTTELEV